MYKRQGADFDSSAPEVTDWYRRTDEDGNPVAYDYETGEFTDSHDVVRPGERATAPRVEPDAPSTDPERK